jgi:hypothetical protein
VAALAVVLLGGTPAWADDPSKPTPEQQQQIDTLGQQIQAQEAHIIDLQRNIDIARARMAGTQPSEPVALERRLEQMNMLYCGAARCDSVVIPSQPKP